MESHLGIFDENIKPDDNQKLLKTIFPPIGRKFDSLTDILPKSNY